MSNEKQARTTMQRNLTLAQMGVFSALIVVMTFTHVGYITIGALSITLVHIPVIVGACVLGWKLGAALGAVWGVTCMIKAFTMPTAPTDPLFMNPLVSLVPRVLVGIVAGLLFALVLKADKKGLLAAAVAAVAATVCNTALVLTALYLIYGGSKGDLLGIQAVSFPGLVKFIVAVFVSNAVFEVIAAVLIAIPAVFALRKVKTRI